MFVKPAPGRAVRDPHTYQLLPDDGRNVPDDSFWLRRLRDGDVVEEEDKRAEHHRRPGPAKEA
jgi:hypothetical protein